MNKLWPFDRGIHFRVLLKGIESSVIIVFSIIIYELIKKLIDEDFIKKFGLPINNNEVVRRILHIFTIFAAEIFLVYILLLLFKTEF